jgi:hypothetical protein
MRTSIALLALLFTFEARAQSSIYGELGGSAVVPSVNYDRHIGKSNRMLGRIGITAVVGSSQNDTQTTLVVPLTVSWITHPEANHHLEAGGGVTLVAGDEQELFEVGNGDEQFNTTFVTGMIGYRYQKPKGGFMFRATITPLRAPGTIPFPWVGFSFGKSW